MSLDTSALSAFFKVIFGPNTGYVCLAFSPDLKKWDEKYYEWPRQLGDMVSAIEQRRGTENVYYCPQLFETRKRNKENVKSAPNIWADLDTCTPEKLMIEPTVTIESSPGRFQAVWVLDEVVDPTLAEHTAMRIAYYHAAHGADRSGWDLSQLLRVPLCWNFKYSSSGTWDAPEVSVRKITRAKYRLSDFEVYPEVRGTKELTLPMPEAPLTEAPLDIMQRYRYMMNPKCFGYFTDEPSGDWSKTLWRLMMYLFEAGLTREEVFHVVQAAGCNKYSRDNKPKDYLWRDVCRAYLRHEENINTVINPSDLSELATDQELKDLDGNDTFIEQYIGWASEIGDAAVQYHTAGAFVVLSAMLAGNVQIPTSWGNIIPNLWFMILGDTTLTRKTTAMNLGMALLEEIDDDILMATDGTVEGMMTSMSARPGRPSVFLRDEFSGLLESMTKKDYMAGMAETFTQLYDGKSMKRLLRKEVFNVRKPILIIFAGGIKAKIQQLLSHEHVQSGFIPRFLFLTGKSDVQKVRPLGPPTIRDLGQRDFILGRMRFIYDHYNQYTPMQIIEKSVIPAKPKLFDAELTPDAWARYNKLESDLTTAGLSTQHPDLMVPMYTRLAVSTLKAATLVAASRQQDEKVLVEEIDIVRGIKYATEWRHYANEVVNGIGRSQQEREIQKILEAITKNPGIARSRLMQNFHLTAQQATQIFGTLEQRGQVTSVKMGQGMTYHPTLMGAE